MLKSGLDPNATQILTQLVHGLGPGEHRKVHTNPSFMATHVECLNPRQFSVAHYFEQNGDLVPDPDMEFWRADDGRFFPVAIQHAVGPYVTALVFDAKGAPDADLRRMRELVSFANMWMRNIAAQQCAWFEPTHAKGAP